MIVVKMEAVKWPWKSLAQAKAGGAIVRFADENAWLSNMSFVDIDAYGVTMPTLEHAYVLAKVDPARVADEDVLKAVIAAVETSASDAAKSLADDLRPLLKETDRTAGRTVRVLARGWARLRAGESKKIGRHLPLRTGWDAGLKWSVMTLLTERKYAPGSVLAKKLLATGAAPLLEGNTWGDRNFGVIDTKAGLEGLNGLGRILMRRREALGGHGAPLHLDTPAQAQLDDDGCL